MPNIHGLHSFRDNDAQDSDDDKDDDNNDRYVGGVDSRGGGSGLAVMPNRDNANNASDASDSIFNLAEAAGSGAASGGSGGGETEVRRTITMYQSGFTVDNGPYRRLDDPDNAEFLTSLARGMVPRELNQEARESGAEGGVVVGLVDRRGEDYDPERHGRQGEGGSGGGFQSFTGEGQSLGGTSSASSIAPMASSGGSVIDPSSASTPQALDTSRPSTSVAIRLLNGKRLVVKLNLDSPVTELGQHIGTQAGMDPYMLTSGYPPAVIADLGKSIEEAGLKGAQVVLKKA